MPNNSTQLTTIKTGMNQDSHISSLQKGQYSFLLNGAIENFDGVSPQIQNDSSNYMASQFPAGFKVIGKKYIPEFERTLYVLVNPDTGEGQWIEAKDCVFKDGTDKLDFTACKDCDKKIYKQNLPIEKAIQLPYCNYRTIITSTCFDFDIDHPIDIEYRRFLNSLYVYFVDAKNPLSFIYFDIDSNNNLVLQDRFKVVVGFDPNNCNLPIYSNEIDCNKIRYNPDYSRPEISNIEDIPGGNIKAGTVQVIVAYADYLGNPLTHYFDKTAPYPIRTKDITIETGYLTDRALSFDINGLDQTNIFQYYNIVVGHTVDNFTTFYLVATLPVSTSHFIYTGDNQVIKKLDVTDIFNITPIFKNAASITKANDYLFFARLREYKKLNLQRAVNRMKVYWQTIAIHEEDLRKAHNVSRFRGFLRDEVYPIGIVVEFKDDNDSIVFPFVGPSDTYFDQQYGVNVNSIVGNNDVINAVNCEGLTRNKQWQVYNTGRVVGTPHQVTTDCDSGEVWEYGEFGYWESTETYPNLPDVWGELCGKPIRHFRFPDSTVTHFHDGLNATRIYGDNNIVFPIGIRIDHQSVIDAFDWAVQNNIISQEDRNRIKGYRIVRGNRFGNKSIQAKGLLYDVWNYNKWGKTLYYPNFPYNDLRDNVLLAPDASVYNTEGNDSAPTPTPFAGTGRYTFHSPDIHFTNTHEGTEIKLETEEYGKTEGYFNVCQNQPKYRILSESARILAFATGVAAAFSSITKDCRQISYGRSYVDASIVGGVSRWVLDDPLVFKYNNIFAPSPVDAEQLISNDCKGTAFQWMSPGMIPFLAAEHGAVAAAMSAVIALAGIAVDALYFLTIMLREINVFTELLKSLSPKKDYFIQYNSVGKYNSYKPVADNGNKVRHLDKFQYLDTTIQNINEGGTDIIFNNWNRESSVYLKTDITKPFFPNPTVTDNSRTTMNQAGLTYSQLEVRINTTISSYYGSIRNYRPNQYGTVYNINYLETNGVFTSIDSVSNDQTYFGGDTFISRLALKIKHPLFIQTRFNQLDEADVSYSELGNAAYPNYYLDFGEGVMQKLASFDIGQILSNPGAFFQDLVGTDDSRLDAKNQKFFYQEGYVHLYSYGIPYFLVESDVNVDYRHAQNTKEKDYYPRQKDLDYWLQEKNVPITEDNTYIYNTTYSKQNRESVLQTIKPNTKFGDILTNDYNLLVYTEKTGTLNETDNWLVILNDSNYRTKPQFGSIISVDGLENDKVLIRCENGSQIFGAYDFINTYQGSQLQINKPHLFESRPQEFALTDLGHMGSQHRDMLNTEFGHTFVDAKRGSVFNIAPGGQGIDELTKNGMRNWFRNNLPFQIKKDFPNFDLIDLDNSYKGVGLALSFDKRFSRFFITKHDYKCINSDVFYSDIFHKFYVGSDEVLLSDTRYFKKKSWTISYNFATETWVSFHSFIPNYYVDYIDHFKTGINENGWLWSHNVSNKSYQVYYGKLEPFIIDIPSQFTPTSNAVNSIEYMNEVVRYHNEFDSYINNNITFNKAIVYTGGQNTGLLNLVVKNHDDLSKNLPSPTIEGLNIYVTNSEDYWRFNGFHDVTMNDNNIPVWLYDPNNVNKQLNKSALDYFKKDIKKPLIRGNICSVRLINDIHSNNKFIFLLNSFNQNTSFS